MIELVLPAHLRTLGRVDGTVQVELGGRAATIGAVLDELEARYPMLCGTIREHGGGKRRPFIRFFACGEDFSHEPPDAVLPEAVVSGKEPLLIVGAIAGV
jgi:molybdopterin synthase sulfur carrier subunit